MKKITKIVVTGGPCAGKTLGLTAIRRELSQAGYKVLTISEMATDLISSGLAPWTCASKEEYQKCQLLLQLYKEKIYNYAADGMDADRIVIVCDRGALDNKAYLSKEGFETILHDVGVTEEELMNRYDAVFHLVTAARGAERFYSLENNSSRIETLEEAQTLDDRLIHAWEQHPYFRIIGNETDFDGKIQKLVDEMKEFLLYKDNSIE